jgi:HSP20 family molecular chaperone IbpA
MKNQTAPEAQATTRLSNLKLIKPESHFDRLKELQEAIACRAFELFETRGCEHGQDLADWLRAESEILQPLPIKVSEYEDHLAIEAELLGFSAEEIKISAEPRRLIICGRAGQTNEEEKENTFSREILVKDTFHLLDLPAEIDADKVEASLRDGILNVTLPKLVADKPSQARASTV